MANPKSDSGATNDGAVIGPTLGARHSMVISHRNQATPECAPIGIFDSGIGGLSVLRHIRALVPHEHLLYFADSGFAPYGDKPEQFIIERSLVIAEFFVRRGIKALVVPCNTATAAAIKALRETYPNLPVVGVEPGLKPAAVLSKTKIVGVLATNGTLASAKFRLLWERVGADTGVRFIPIACIGLADQIENGELQTAATVQMIERFVRPLIEQDADTLVLGCTHYPFVRSLIEDAAKRWTAAPIAIIDTGEAVARQLARVLQENRLQCMSEPAGALEAFTTSRAAKLRDAFSKLLELHPVVTEIAPPTGGGENS